ncbi:MAG: M3 family oligoendopeptidase [Rhodothermales bacterium]
MSTATLPTTGAEDVRWNLADLYADTDALDADLASADADAARFADAYRGRLADLRPSAFADALDALESIHDRLGRAYTYAYLHWSTNTEDAERGALLQRVREAYTQSSQKLIFFDVEWARMDDDRATAFLDADALASHRHHLELQRLRREHVLSEGEERVLSEKAITGNAAWNRFFDETLGAARFELRGETLPEQTVLSKLHDPDRSLRRDAALSLTEGLGKLARPLTFVFNTVLADKASTDRLRHYPHWLASRNLDNEIADASVQALVDAVTDRYDLSERYYRLKRSLLGLDEMMDYDRYAPIGEVERHFDWDEARDTVLDAYTAFHPTMGEVTEQFFDGRWIDAPVAEGKRGGAFSHGAVPSAHPYILMNFTGRVRDVQTLAHELGHGVHQFLAREQGVFHADTPLTTAETASVFGEMLVFHRLLDRETDPKARLAMLVQKIDDSMATVFRQVTMNRFEHAVHTIRRDEGELTTERFGDVWMETQGRMYGDAVTLGEHYRRWWSYIPHFVHTPGYVYAYAFGELLVLALYARYRDGQDGFTDAYLDLLRAGGSDWPHVLVGKLGIDLQDPAFWQQGLGAIEALIAEAEAAARQA